MSKAVLRVQLSESSVNQHSTAYLWVTSACKPVFIVSTSCAMFLASPYFSTSPSQPSLTMMSNRGFPKAARTSDAVMLEGLDRPTGVSKSGRPWLSRRGRACSCFVDRSRGGLSGNAPAQPWQHKQTTKTVSRHKPRYHVSHDAIQRGKTSRCPLAEQLLFHPPLILPQIRSHQSVC